MCSCTPDLRALTFQFRRLGLSIQEEQGQQDREAGNVVELLSENNCIFWAR